MRSRRTGGQFRPVSQPILFAARSLALSLTARSQIPRDDQPMAGDVEVVLLGHPIAQLDQFVALKFDQLVATLAVEMVVLGIAVVMLVDGSASQFELPQQPGVDKFIERAVDGGTTDVARLDLYAAACRSAHRHRSGRVG